MRPLKLAVRTLLRTPFVTAVAVLSLGLGIGANTAVFSLFNQILFQPLPVAAPTELVNLSAPGDKNGSVSCGNAGDCDTVFSYPMYQDLQAAQQVFTGIAAHRLFNANINDGHDVQTGDALEVSGNYFQVLGLRPALGRLIEPADTPAPGDAPVAVLAYDYWTSRFGHDLAVVGRTVVVNGQTLTVVGVAPEGFDGTTRGTRARLFVPITLRGLMEPPFDGFADRKYYWAYLFARLRPGVTIDAARTSINGPYHALLASELPDQGRLTDQQKAAFLARPLVVEDGRRGQSYIFGQATTPFAVLLAVTAVVLLIACANIANLLLARAAGRANEMAVRLSIGASRMQLIRQLLLESCLLAALGGAAGLVMLDWMVGLMTSQLSIGSFDPALSRVHVGALGFAAGLSLVTGVLFGLVPALHATRPDLAAVLKGQAGQPSGARSAARFRTALVVTQIALSMGLLTCAGLFTKSLVNVSRVDLGLKIDDVVTFRLNPQQIGYTTERAQQLFDQVLERLAAAPGFVSVSAARVPIVANSSSSTSISVEGYTPAPDERTSININQIGPGFFRTVGIPFIGGRDFTPGDTNAAPKVAIVNQAFTRRFNLGASPIGHRMRIGGGPGGGPMDIEIVGLVADATYSRVRSPMPPVFYIPYRQDPRVGSIAFYAKVAGDPQQQLTSIRPLVASFDSNLPVQRLMTMSDQVANNVSNDRLLSVMSASFAGIATSLAAIGLYGVLAFTVSQRTREFGVRMALGAEPSAVQRLVLRDVLRMTALGGLIGLVLAIAAGSLARSLLFNMQSADPTVLVLSTAFLALVAFAAGYVPSRRASRIDPMRALRWE